MFTNNPTPALLPLTCSQRKHLLCALLLVAACAAAMQTGVVWSKTASAANQTANSNSQASKAALAERVVRRIDVGNLSAYTDSEGRMWSADTDLFTPERALPESRGKPIIAGAVDPVIYHTYRGNVGGKTPQAERLLTFNIPIPGHRKVDLRLHFVELYWGAPGGGPAGPGKRVFDVEVENKNVLEDFDITKASGGALRAVVVPIKDVAVEDEILTIVFRPDKDFAAVSAIEVLADTQR